METVLLVANIAIDKKCAEILMSLTILYHFKYK